MPATSERRVRVEEGWGRLDRSEIVLENGASVSNKHSRGVGGALGLALAPMIGAQVQNIGACRTGEDGKG